MRKALTFSAIALASSMALAVPTVAFAADAGPSASSSPSASPGTSTGTGTHSAPVALKLSASSAKTGDSIRLSMEVPDGSTNLSISSKALDNVKMTDGRGATATVAKVSAGTYGVSLTGTGPDGKKLQASAQLTVKGDAPKPGESTLSLSKDHGKPGDKIVVTVKTTEKSAYVTSGAFGGTVNLKNDGKGTWTGTATVAKDVKSGYYGVDAFAGGKKFDTVKFSTEATEGNGGKKTDPKKITPLNPGEHKKPKGSVNTGQAPVGYVAEDTANHG
ncbi:hypothetical protein OHS33_20275 [Streptomyces sp. NBC_00536]|uniref:hypothetical protein n=1 Tax=Streptomyces sp. NBC_00536 TaxID=2975769 RepID=UPI002E822B50|nr:hypothetical protein [Streptomyces sp. NBC_00536]WUC80453.1 hypothetical protein OHS33_20275 [Streptomyces sp. NBC_00536]